MTKWIIFLLIFTSIVKLIAQSDSSNILKIDFELRERFELWNGMNMLCYGEKTSVGESDDKFLFQRVIVGFNYNFLKHFKAVLRIQDSRAFGWSLANSKEQNAFKIPSNANEHFYIMNPGEEYFELNNCYLSYQKEDTAFSYKLKLGRQIISFGDNRIFAPADWSNSMRCIWDALRLDVSGERWHASFFVGGTKVCDPHEISLPFNEVEYRGGGIYSQYKLTPENITFEPFFAIKLPGTADYIRTLRFEKKWVGFRIFDDNLKNFLFDATFSLLNGNNSGREIRAYGYAAKAGYIKKFNSSQLKIYIRRTFASGGSQSSRIIKTFENPYGAIDKYLGRMNIFRWSNIDDIELAVELSLQKSFKLELSFHNYYLPYKQNAVILNSLRSDNKSSFIGNEINLFTQFKPFKSIQLTGVIGMFFPKNLELLTGETPRSAFMTLFQFHYFFSYKTLLNKK